MAITFICDADRTTQLKPEEVTKVGWGLERIYGPEAIGAVSAYWEELQVAARESRALFESRRGEARRRFREVYPDGLLPDEEEKRTDEPTEPVNEP